jgi:hypothetical protein
VEQRRGQRGGGLERHVGVVHIVAFPRHRSIIVAAAANSRAQEECVLELAISSSPRSRGPVGGPSLRGARQDGCPRDAGSPASSGRPTEAVGGAASSNPPTLRWLQPPRLGLPVEAPVTGKVDRLGVDAERTTRGGLQHRPTAPSVITYPGRQSPGCTRFPCRQRGPRIGPGRGGGRTINP